MHTARLRVNPIKRFLARFPSSPLIKPFLFPACRSSPSFQWCCSTSSSSSSTCTFSSLHSHSSSRCCKSVCATATASLKLQRDITHCSHNSALHPPYSVSPLQHVLRHFCLAPPLFAAYFCLQPLLSSLPLVPFSCMCFSCMHALTLIFLSSFHILFRHTCFDSHYCHPFFLSSYMHFSASLSRFFPSSLPLPLCVLLP